MEFLHAETSRRTFVFDFDLDESRRQPEGTLFPATSKHFSSERRAHAPWGRRSVGWSTPSKNGEVWSGILPGKKARRAWKSEQEIHVETFSLKGEIILRAGKGSRRSSFAGQRDLIDIHPTRGDLLLMRDPEGQRKYSVLQMRKRAWSWILLRATEKPIWTRIWFKSFGSHLLHPFEFWEGTVYSLGHDSVPKRTEL